MFKKLNITLNNTSILLVIIPLHQVFITSLHFPLCSLSMFATLFIYFLGNHSAKLIIINENSALSYHLFSVVLTLIMDLAV